MVKERKITMSSFYESSKKQLTFTNGIDRI